MRLQRVPAGRKVLWKSQPLVGKAVKEEEDTFSEYTGLFWMFTALVTS